MPTIEALQQETPFSAISGQDKTKKDWFSSDLPGLLGLTSAGSSTGFAGPNGNSFASADAQAVINALMMSQGLNVEGGAKSQSTDPFMLGGGDNTPPGYNIEASGPTLATTNPDAAAQLAGVLGVIGNPGKALAGQIGAPNIGQITGTQSGVFGPTGFLGSINPTAVAISQIIGKIAGLAGLPSGALGLAQTIAGLMGKHINETLNDLSVHAPSKSFDPTTETSLANMGLIGFSNTVLNMLGSKFFAGPTPTNRGPETGIPPGPPGTSSTGGTDQTGPPGTAPATNPAEDNTTTGFGPTGLQSLTDAVATAMGLTTATTSLGLTTADTTGTTATQGDTTGTPGPGSPGASDGSAW